jgi:hypothetical protein
MVRPTYSPKYKRFATEEDAVVAAFQHACLMWPDDLAGQAPQLGGAVPKPGPASLSAIKDEFGSSGREGESYARTT